MKILENFDLVNSHRDQTLAFLLLTANWMILYFIVHNTFRSAKLKQKAILDTKNRIVSIVHGVISFFLSGSQFIGADFNLPNTQIENFICLFSLSYSFYDTIACSYYGLADSGLYFHHICCLIGLGAPLYYSYGAVIALGGLFTAQVSNLPMHLRVLLRNYGLKYTKSYEFFENIYIGFYAFFRGIITPLFVFIPAILAQNSPIICIIICIGILAQSFYYIAQMRKIITRKLKNYKEMDQKNIQFKWLSEEKKVQELSFYKGKGGPHIF